ncbi:MAG: tetratricopeptide repeat protein [Rhodospirillaceae bacterium]|nr:tetratricopeptide repeat protein [Rhodospirillaceae bacterium]MBT3926770.1 tetratricopeptide repeat protein [Rhodospirillaceae bacterium]MBT4425755.1 tetratricopeptide repeat protein [Rhodospirillaceae bacterium]
MQDDCFGLAMTAASPEAAQHYDEVLRAYLGFRNDTGIHLKQALAADEGLFMGHCIKGYFFKLFAMPALEIKALESAGRAREFAKVVSARECEHLLALEAWCAGDMIECTARWEGILVDCPRDILALRLAHFCHFYSGNNVAMRDSVARAMPAWQAGEPGAGYVQGMYAFGLEECGEYDAALKMGEGAVKQNPGDIWAVHAVAHVHEMAGRSAEGIAWLKDTEDGWRGCNNFTNHVWWHRALYHFELAQYEEVLRLYDENFRAEPSEDYLDISNAVAMLWRLENAGIAVAGRWDELADKAEKRTAEHLLVFADLHFAIALAAAGRGTKLDRMIDSMRLTISTRRTTQEQVLAEVGATMAQAVRAQYQGDFELALRLMLPLRYHVRAIGGSNAQRDIFSQMLIEAALKSGKHALARALLHERVALKPGSVRSWNLLAEALDGEGRASDAAEARRHAEQLLAA